MTPPLQPEVIVCCDSDDLARIAADRVVQLSNAAVEERGKFTIALSGGSTPERTYALLAATSLDWTKTWVFFGDERFVPSDDARSNYHMARRALLDKILISDQHVFPIRTNLPSPSESAADYARTLADFFDMKLNATPPRFDLILLGLGDDGHSASLFPHAPALEVSDAWVCASPPGSLPPPVQRITLTYPVLNAARHIIFLAAGIKKAEPLRDVLEGNVSRDARPAAGIRPVDGTITWLADEAAASLLQRSAQ